jgi:hypothetical protein
LLWTDVLVCAVSIVASAGAGVLTNVQFRQQWFPEVNIVLDAALEFAAWVISVNQLGPNARCGSSCVQHQWSLRNTASGSVVCHRLPP